MTMLASLRSIYFSMERSDSQMVATRRQKPLFSLMRSLTSEYICYYLYYVVMAYFIWISIFSHKQLISLLDSFKIRRFESRAHSRRTFLAVIALHLAVFFIALYPILEMT